MAVIGAPRLLIASFDAPREPEVAAWGRQVPAVLHERLSQARGLRVRLWPEPGPVGGAIPREALLTGEVDAGTEVAIGLRLLGPGRADPVYERLARFPVRSFFASRDRLADDVARALGASPPPPRAVRETGSFPALRD